MFEGIVIQVLAGYLGRYVKGIQKDQLKIGIWNEEVLLEKVELILEAFDYLRLPFALKQGRIGKLSIKIPWKKLGWDPIIIILEDVFITACQREETEWSLESIEKRELAAKMAKLNAAELAKISKRVSGDQAGQSFISYVSAKILDNIQVYIQDVHVVYVDIQKNLEKCIFGLRFSSLKIRTDGQKTDPTGSYVGKVRSCQVSKTIEISRLGFYCNSFDDKSYPLNIDGSGDSWFYVRDLLGHGAYDYMVSPFDFSLSLLVNKSATIDGSPQYTVIAQLTSMVLSLEEIQVKQILSLWDHFSVCALREKYGRYRPYPFTKCDGWQRRWWHYAQESILSDVRLRLRKTSWRKLGRRIILRRKYVSLYKRKLESIQKHQIVGEDILLELEQLDKQFDIEDILSYRSIAEKQLQDSAISLKPQSSDFYPYSCMKENLENDEQISSNARSWLNWLSLGMLGAGGTANSSSFSGIVSDEIIKDIYEAAEFRPSQFEVDKMTMQNFTVFLMKFNIQEAVLMIRNKRYGCDFARVSFHDSSVDLEVSEDSTAAVAFINSVKVINLFEEKVMLISREVASDENVPGANHPFVRVQFKMPQKIYNTEISVVFHPFEVIWDGDFFQNLFEFGNMPLSFEFQSKRVLSSLNRFEDDRARLFSKALYMLSTNRRLIWDATFNKVSVKFPCKKDSVLVLNMETFFCRSRPEAQSNTLMENAKFNDLISDFHLYTIQDMPQTFELHDLYDHFEIGVTGLEACMSAPSLSQATTIVEKCDAIASFSICIFFDEPLLRQMEVHCSAASVVVLVSPSIYIALSELLYAFSAKRERKSVDIYEHDLCTFQYFMLFSLRHFTLLFNLENDKENSTVISFALEDIYSRCFVREFLELAFCLKTITIESFTSKFETDGHVLCSSTCKFPSKPNDLIFRDLDLNSPWPTCENAYSDGCLLLHYRTCQCDLPLIYEYDLVFNDIDLNIHPKIFGLVNRCLMEISGQFASPECSVDDPCRPEKDINGRLTGLVGIQDFGFSNFHDAESILSSISLNCFPFMTVQNTDVLCSTGSTFALNIHSWQNLQVMGDWDLGSPNFDFSRRFRNLQSSTLMDSVNLSTPSPFVGHVLVMGVRLNEIRVHFHDSTCILGTISLPKCKSLFSSCGSYWDLLCSAKGLTLSTSWSSSSTQVVLGPALANVCPIMNIRARSERTRENSPICEISLGIQHVNCTLPSEFLAIIIDYCMLSDWTPPKNGTHDKEMVQQEKTQSWCTAFKFEILGSTLRLPSGCSNDYYLCFGLQLLYCCFLSGVDAINNMGALPIECRIKSLASVDLKFLNMFGHNISLSLHSIKTEKQSIDFAAVPMSREIRLIEKLNADLSIRIPCDRDFCAEQSSYPLLVRMTVKACHFLIGDHCFFALVAVMNAIDQYAAVGAESESYEYDEFQLIQSKRMLKEATGNPCVGKVTRTYIIEMSANMLCILLNQVVLPNTLSEVIAEAEVCFSFDMTCVNDVLRTAKIAISQLLLRSFDNSILLSSSEDVGAAYCSLLSNITRPGHGKMELFVHFPFLDIWLHLSDWHRIIDCLCTYIKQPAGPSGTTSTCEVLETEIHNCNKSEEPSISGNLHNPNEIWLKLENVRISFYLPLVDRNYSSEKFTNSEILGKKESKFLKFYVQSRGAELTVSKTDMKLETYVEVVRGILEVVGTCEASSMPFLLISQVALEAEFLEIGHPIMHCRSEVCVESVDVRLSHEIFKFWHSIQVPESESAPGIPFTIDFKAILNKGSVFLNDEKWSCTGPIFEFIMKHAVLKAKTINCLAEACLTCEIAVNYKNIPKMMWEAFVEPWRFDLKLVREYENIISSPHGTSDIYLKSSDLLNLNATEPLIEVISRVAWIVRDAHEEIKLNHSRGNLGFHGCKDLDMKRCAPYVLQNDTSLPLLFWVSYDYADETSLKSGPLVEGNVQPGFSMPIFIEEATIEKNILQKISPSSNSFLDKGESSAPHHMISIQLEGASSPSKPMSMDLVGINCFEANFSDCGGSNSIEISRLDVVKSDNTHAEEPMFDGPSGSVVPVVFDVSMHNYGKLIRLHSKVMLLNETSKPLELRFDIPFAICWKSLGPVPAGQEFPLPVHLAESGTIRWRPVGSDYLWSDAYSLSSMLSNEQKTGISRLCVCYPTNHSSDPFRCCISVEDYNIGSPAGPHEGSSSQILRGETHHIDNVVNNQAKPSRWPVRQIRLVTPILIKNCLPTAFSLEIDSSGLMRSVFLPENGILPLYHTDSAHDLGITFHMQGFRPTVTRLPRADTFLEISKSKNSCFSISETLAFYPDTSSGAVFVSLEKTIDACSGAREMCLFVPYLLYNCTGIPFAIVDGDLDGKGNFFIIPSSYNLVEQNHFFPEEDGLSLFPLDSKKSSIRENTDIYNHLFSRRHFSSDLPRHYPSTTGSNSCPKKIFPCKSVDRVSIAAGSVLTKAYSTKTGAVSQEVKDYCGVKPCIYSPSSHLPSTELLVRLQAYFPQLWAETNRSSTDSWSAPFSLIPASGSTSVIIPQPTTAGAFLASVTSSPISGDHCGRTRVIIFQPRYVICNTFSKDLCYRQKGTNFFYRLGAGQHFHLHWADRTRELLISIRFNELGWQWSGSFLPDCLGDTLVKMRNYVTRETCMVRVEVQNADTAGHDVNTIMTTNGASGTHIILLSDDNTGFMPYRIDNYSMERIRVYQHKCEMFETIVHSYTSCQYAWDEPTLPHRLTIEAPGERILGTYNFDEVGEYADVCIPQILEKPERRLFIAVHAEGAIKVLTIIESRYHNIKDIKENNFFRFGERKISYKGTHADYSERIRIQLSVGFSLVDSAPEELIYARAEDITITWLQYVDQQKIFFQILSLQIDNQIRSTQYPVIMSFNPESVKNSLDQSKKENKLRIQDEDVSMFGGLTESVLHISVAKWRKKEASLISFENINIRLSPLHFEIEERVLFQLLDFLKIVSSKFHGVWQTVNYEIEALDYHSGTVNAGSNVYHCNFKGNLDLEHHPSLPNVIPIGAPWQKIFPSSRKHRKIYVEVFTISALSVTLSFSSSPWMRLKNIAEPVSLLHFSSMKFQRSLMALVDVEGVHFHLGELTLTHLMASWRSIQDILIRHYSRQLLHESYKVFGSAGVIGNPIGFARNVGTGIKDLLSVSAKDLVQSPSEVITDMAQGSKSLFSNTIYALSSATTQFSKAAHKGIVAFALDDQTVAKMENHKGLDSHSRGLLNEFFEGLTGLLQSPIRGAEKHGLPGVLSGIAMGTAGLVARPMASILEATGRTAQGIRNRSSPNQSKRCRIRLPRPVARDLPLLPYSWEEAIGTSVLLDGGESRMKNETFVLCKSLKQPGKFVVLTKRLLLAVSSSGLVGLGLPEFTGIADPNWVIEMEMALENIFHVDRSEEVVKIVGHTDTPVKQKTSTSRTRQCSYPMSSPFFHMSVEFSSNEEAEEVIHILLYTIEQGESERWGKHTLRRSRYR